MSNDIAVLAKECNIEVAKYNAISNVLFPGETHEMVKLIIDYCVSKNLDPLSKPVHVVELSYKDKEGSWKKKKAVMPGIASYRATADSSGVYMGMDEPIFGEEITEKLGDKMVTYPKSCLIVAKKLVEGKICTFPAIEFWKENYATIAKTHTPNEMWAKRPYGQLAKCAEAQALRKAFPSRLGQEYTFEEMEGKGAVYEHADAPNQIAEKAIKIDLEMAEPESEIRYPSESEIEAQIADIIGSQDLMILRRNFEQVWKRYEHFKPLQERFSLVKDERKAQLMAMAEESVQNLGKEFIDEAV